MGLISKEVEIRVTSKEIKHYEDLGYDIPKRKASPNNHSNKGKGLVYDLGAPMTVKVEDLLENSTAKVLVECDYCHKIKPLRYQSFRICFERHGIYACRDCGHHKIQLTMVERYGKRFPIQVPEFKEKQRQTTIQHYGTEYPQQNKEIQEKTKQTNLLRYDSEYTLTSPEFRAKGQKKIQEVYGVDNVSKSPIIQFKIRESLYKNGTCVCSAQQKYLHNLFGGELNYPFDYYSLDIAFPDEKLTIAYDGGGHDLSVKLGEITEKDFRRREIIRSNYLKLGGWKEMKIISADDRLPSDETLLLMLDISKQYFEDYPNHSWFEWNITKNSFRNAETMSGGFFNYGELRTIKGDDGQIAL